MEEPVSRVAVPSQPSAHRGTRAVAHRLRIQAVALTDAGLVRANNEDAFVVAPDIGLFAVADGMGGAAAGEVAARMAIEAVRATIEDPEVTWPGGSGSRPCPEPGAPLLVAAVERANARVHNAAKADRAKAGMGTTFTGLLFFEGGTAVAHVGDSRAWRLRDGVLEALTTDHTLTREAIDAGEMTPDEARTSKLRHVISRAVGAHEEVRVDGATIDARAGDLFLLATDGLHGVVGEDDITAALQCIDDLALTEVAEELFDAAFDAGAPDNVTLVGCRSAADGVSQDFLIGVGSNEATPLSKAA
jgi:protein phosphatase